MRVGNVQEYSLKSNIGKASYENARVDIDTEGFITVYSLQQFPEHPAELVAEYNRLEVGSWEYE
jgi:hypothetical protein